MRSAAPHILRPFRLRNVLHPRPRDLSRPLLRQALFLSVLATASACSTPLFKPRIALADLRFEVDRQANDASPFAVELVAVADEDILKKLLALSAAQWFDPQSNIKRDYPAGIQTWYYELTPGLRMAFKPTPFARRPAQALLLFANYKGSGAYRLRLDSYPAATVIFADKDIRIGAAP